MTNSNYVMFNHYGIPLCFRHAVLRIVNNVSGGDDYNITASLCEYHELTDCYDCKEEA